jgi:hypothetical protein
MKLNLIGLNHKTAPIEIREKFVFSQDMLSHILKDLKLKTGQRHLYFQLVIEPKYIFVLKNQKKFIDG